MLVAYLRGLLTPGYPQGVRSIIRENFVLQSLARELEANEVLARSLNESHYASLMKPDQANKLLKHHDKMLSLAFNNLKHKVDKINHVGVDIAGIDSFKQAYMLLKKQGLVGEVNPKDPNV